MTSHVGEIAARAAAWQATSWSHTVAPSGWRVFFWATFIDIGPVLAVAAVAVVLWLAWVLLERRLRRLVIRAVRDALVSERGSGPGAWSNDVKGGK